HEKYSTSYNFGPEDNDHLPVKDLVDLAISRWGNGSWSDKSVQTAPHEAGVLQLDISLAKKELGWSPKLDSRTAINWTIDWYRQPEAAKFDFTVQQIKNYEAL
ncbi:MAG: CDP-glucose 4,6-dehydratase, partial [Chitinophagaceae bacterium]